MPPTKRRNLAAVQDAPTPTRERAPDLRDAVKAALKDMTWLTPADEGTTALALRLADEIEKSIDRAEELTALRRECDDDGLMKRLKALEAQYDTAKTVGWLGPQLQGVLRDLYGTPASRKDMKKNHEQVGGRLAQLRASRLG